MERAGAVRAGGGLRAADLSPLAAVRDGRALLVYLARAGDRLRVLGMASGVRYPLNAVHRWQLAEAVASARRYQSWLGVPPAAWSAPQNDRRVPMGLDWMLHGSKPKPGCEKQFHRINDKLAALDTDAALNEEKKKQLRSDLELALKSVSISPFEVIGAPRVGIDADATEWFHREVYGPLQLRLAQARPQARREAGLARGRSVLLELSAG